MDLNRNTDEFCNELAERLFVFASDVIRFLGKLGNDPESKIIKYQLAKSAGSSGANYSPCQIALDG